MINKFKSKIRKNTEILALGLLIIVTIISTTYYNYNKKRIYNNFKSTINNIYLKKSVAYLFSNLEPKFKKINHIISPGETFDSILEDYKIEKKEIIEIKNKLSNKINLNKLNTNQKLIFTLDQSTNVVKNFLFQISNTEKIYLTRNNKEDMFDQKILVTKLEKKVIYSENKIFDIHLNTSKTNITSNKSVVINLETLDAINISNIKICEIIVTKEENDMLNDLKNNNINNYNKKINEFKERQAIRFFVKKLKSLRNLNCHSKETFYNLLDLSKREYRIFSYLKDFPYFTNYKPFNIFDILVEVYQCYIGPIETWEPCSLTKLHKWIIKFQCLKPEDLFGKKCKINDIECGLTIHELDSTIDYVNKCKDDKEIILLVYTFEIKPESDCLPVIQLNIPYSINKLHLETVQKYLKYNLNSYYL